MYQQLQGKLGVPKLYWAGSEGEYVIMVIELLGPSLENLFRNCNQRFSLATTFALAHQLVKLLRYQ